MPAPTMTPQERRAASISRMRSIYEDAERESRDLTAEEQQEFDRLDGEVDSLQADIDRRSRLDARLEVDGDPEEERRSGWHSEDEEQRQREVERDREREARGQRVGDLRERDERRAQAMSLNEYRQREFGSLPQDDPEYRDAFYKMLTSDRGRLSLDAAETRALSKATAAAGANLVPQEFERTLLTIAVEYGVMRELATVITSSNGEEILMPTEVTHGVAAWIGENNAYSESDEVFGQASLKAYKAGTIMKVSEELLTDAVFDLESYIARQYASRIGILENTAYVVGDGTGKPTGITVTATAGKTGVAGQTTSLIATDLFDLYHSVIRPYRQRGTFLLNDGTLKAIRLLKDTTNQYLWQPGLQADAPDTLLGRPVMTDPDMPVMAANAKSILFGDFSYYYIRDVAGIAFQRLNELYAANGQVGFKAYHRSDGKLLNTGAVKAYVNSAT